MSMYGCMALEAKRMTDILSKWSKTSTIQQGQFFNVSDWASQ